MNTYSLLFLIIYKGVRNMPAFDGTGPQGKGPGTGRGLGRCEKGKGLGQGLRRGMGGGRRFGQGQEKENIDKKQE